MQNHNVLHPVTDYGNSYKSMPIKTNCDQLLAIPITANDHNDQFTGQSDSDLEPLEPFTESILGPNHPPRSAARAARLQVATARPQVTLVPPRSTLGSGPPAPGGPLGRH